MNLIEEEQLLLKDILGRVRSHQKEKPWNSSQSAQNFIGYSQEIIRNFMYLAATDPEIFPEQQPIDPEADKSADSTHRPKQKSWALRCA
jgi:hypothetical protein